MKQRFLVGLLVIMSLIITTNAHAIGDIAKGSRGVDVQLVQQRLIDLGFLAGNADGIYGAQTEDAVKGFQEVAEITITGIVDSDTYDLLMADVAPISPFVLPLDVELGMSFVEIREIYKPLFNLEENEIQYYDKSGEQTQDNSFSMYWNGGLTNKIPFFDTEAFGAYAITNFFFSDDTLSDLTSVLYKYKHKSTEEMLNDYYAVNKSLLNKYGESEKYYDWEPTSSESLYGSDYASAIDDEVYSMSDVWVFANATIAHSIYYTSDDEVVHQIYISFPDDE